MIRTTTANGAKFWAVALPDGGYKWYAVPRTVGTGESLPGITVESYVATGRFITNQSGERAEIYVLSNLEPQARSVARAATLHESIQAQLAMGFPEITIHHHGGTVTLTPAQGRAVLAGGELVVDAMGVRVK